MIDVQQTDTFKTWLDGLRDDRAAARIAIRIARLRSGLMGDVKPIGDGLSELRIDTGPGYRVYLAQRGRVLVVLLCGGDKRTQQRDIRLAKELAAQWRT